MGQQKSNNKQNQDNEQNNKQNQGNEQNQDSKLTPKDILTYKDKKGDFKKEEINKVADRIINTTQGIPGIEDAIKVTRQRLNSLYADLEEQKVIQETLIDLLNDFLADEEKDKIRKDNHETPNSTKE